VFAFACSLNRQLKRIINLMHNLLMGDEVANTMMEHLPPSGWSDVARKPDIELLQKGADRLEKRVDHLVAGMWTLGFITATGFIGVYAQIATKF
jgi:hypothetical protein